MSDTVSRSAIAKWLYNIGQTKLAQVVMDEQRVPSVPPEKKIGHNCNDDYAECDQFVCSECGIEIQDWNRVERDEDDGEISYHLYTFKFCPNCGADVRGDENENN